jgi:HEAT repeat protein
MRGLGLQQVREGAPGAAQKFAELLPQLAPQNQAALLDALGERGDRTARPAVFEILASPEPQVRAAALKALGELGVPEDVPLLASRAAQGAAVEQPAARQSLIKLRGAPVNPAMIALAERAEPNVRAELLQALAARKAAEAVPAFLRHTADADARVRLAAWAGLQALARGPELAGMIGQLARARGEAERAAAEAAIASVCARSGPSGLNVLTAKMPAANAADRQVLLRVLAGAGGLPALEAIKTSLTDADPAVREQALRLLSDWSNTAAAPSLARLGRETTNAVHKTLALRGLVRLATIEEPADTSLLVQAWQLANHPADQRLVLGALGAANTPAALSAALPALSDPVLEAEAALAVVMIADKLPPAHANAARAALQKVIQAAKDPLVRERAQKRLNSLGSAGK